MGGMTTPLYLHSRIPRALHCPPPTDYLSLALFQLSQHPTFKKFNLDLDSCCCLPRTVLPDDSSAVTSSALIWPALEYMEVSAYPTTPTGDWYFESYLPFFDVCLYSS